MEPIIDILKIKLLKQQQMKKNHTPGEWMFSKNSHDYSVYSDQNPATIANVLNTSREISDEEAEANARLMASAPKLVHALTAIVARIQGDFDNPALMAYGELWPNSEADILRIARKALSEAIE
jgi:hypothetical protein